MGNGFYVQIVNATPYTLNIVGGSEKSYQMNDWQPPSQVAANSFAKFYGEFQDEEPIHDYLDDSASVSYTLGGVPGFGLTIDLTVTGVNNLPSYDPTKINVGRWYESGYGVRVQWTGLPSGLFVFPPPDSNNMSAVGWVHNGVVTIALGWFPGGRQPTLSPYQTPNYGGGDFYDELTALRPSVLHWAANWMQQYATCIGDLALTELTLPGTHDAGTYPAPQLSTAQAQYLSIIQQLQEGIRAIDLRFQVDGTGPDRFYISHTIKVNLTLSEILDQIQQFLAANPSEVIILDMHRFENTWADQDFYDFANAITTAFGDMLIPPPPSGGTVPTLNAVLATPGRVVVGMGQYSGGAMTPGIVTWLQANTNFWTNAVEQKWSGKSTTTWDTIADFMTTVLNGTDAPWDHLWALMAQYNLVTSFDEPAYVPQELSTFFSSGSNGLKANIIHSDWWDRFNSTTAADDEINIPNFGNLLNALGYNLLKGYRVVNNLPLW